MATKTVTGKLTDPSNVAIAGALVTAQLSQGAVIAATQEIAATAVTTATAANGTWSLSLEANGDLTPNTTFYAFTVGGWSGTGIVPQTAGPFTIEAIAQVPPAQLLGGTAATINPAGDIAGRSLTVSASGPYTNTAANGGGDFKNAAPVTANSGLINLGDGTWDGATGGFFVGAGAGTILALNLSSGSTQHMLDFQANGASKFGIGADGSATHNALVTFNQGTALLFDDTVTPSQAVFGEAIKTGLAAGNTKAVIHTRASNSGFINDGPHDFNVGIFGENYTANGAGWVLSNLAGGDGLYGQTTYSAGDGVSAGQSGWLINLSSGGAAATAGVGDMLHFQRWGAGAAISMVSNATAGTGSGRALQPDISVSHANLSPFLQVADSGTTTGNLVNLTRTAATSGHFIQAFHATSAFTGDVLFANLAVGSGTFTGKFLDFQVNNASQLSVDSAGRITGASNLLLNAVTGNQVFFQVNSSSQGSVGTNGFRVIAGQGFDCLSAGAMTVGGVNASSVVVAKSGASLGFYGHAATAQAAHPALLADVITLLTNLGLCA